MTADQTAAPETEAKTNPHADERLKIVALARQWWRRNMVKTVDQLDVIRRTKEECDLSGRYIFMTSMSAGIAVLGLILSSPAVVIGAMLLSPLMGPIIGAGFAIAIWDVKWLRVSGRTLFIGVIAAILLSALISWMSPIQTVTPEIAGRTQPSLLDLAVALFSGLAGSYAMIRGRAGTIVGVAIAVALMPPLGVVGFGLATLNWTVFGGALMLFITNLVTIAATSAVMARLYGFRTNLSKKRSAIQSVVIALSLLVLAIPLYFSLGQIAWEARATRAANQVLAAQFDNRARFQSINVNTDSDPVTVSAAVFTSEYRGEASTRAQELLSQQLGVPVAVEIEQFRVPIASRAAEEAELAAARNRQQAEATQRTIDRLVDLMALVGGVPRDDVLIDRERRRAVVRARPIEGATLSAYRRLELRIAATVPDWTVQLIPPARSLPDVAISEDGVPDARAVRLIAWAGERISFPVLITGSSDNVEIVRQALEQAGLEDVQTAAGSGDAVTAEWTTPRAD
ncbi:TIGR00341 family protein [Sphingomicrobium lutaoense]|uniref:Putative hydrophobic protein (TIGR00271 family) n=1 Tax=Sphingomicrobium lutaoense TaxID=515949 RepID=A0A839Z4G1_9SPHN|nr:TIGR00341 family protein [Sphingomicrobium lutaoense]MBB3764505.1 putative hydrophobic protein (TIGR00271 family) [Sphingomicrobium lutaoense]